MSIESIKKACDVVGGVSRLSKILDVKPPSIQQWLSGRRPIPVERCSEIERATGGKVRCEDLRPDLRDMWAYLRGSESRAASVAQAPAPADKCAPPATENGSAIPFLIADAPCQVPGAAPANLDADCDFPLPVQDDRRGGDQRSGQDRRKDDRRSERDVQSGVRVDLIQRMGDA